MLPSSVHYLRSQFVNHARLFLAEEIASLLQSDIVEFVPYEKAIAHRGRAIVLPVDIPIPSQPESAWKVPFNGTEVTLWNRIPHPEGDAWRALPNDTTPVWYQHTSGTLLPSWNLFGNVFDLLTFGEEQRIPRRDHHQRFSWKFSPRLGRNLLDVPAFNEAVALLAEAVEAVSRESSPNFSLTGMPRAPVVVLSHDCDILAGNDFWTQAVRLYRTVLPLTKLRLPRIGNLWWFARNLLNPRRYYLDNATGMMDLERCLGFESTFYMLNGSGGRFGARSPFSMAAGLVDCIPSPWQVGMHYNYDTHLDRSRFAAQLDQLQKATPYQITSGRAHYLRFDPFRSFDFWREHGIVVDESSGWPDYVGYRNGIAGCFQVFDAVEQKPLDIWEVPLIIVEDALVGQYGTHAVDAFKRHLMHLSRIGGALSVLVHPGQFFNPEYRAMLGVYHGILKAAHRMGAVSCTADRLVERVRRSAGS